MFASWGMDPVGSIVDLVVPVPYRPAVRGVAAALTPTALGDGTLDAARRRGLVP